MSPTSAFLPEIGGWEGQDMWSLSEGLGYGRV